MKNTKLFVSALCFQPHTQTHTRVTGEEQKQNPLIELEKHTAML